MADLRVTMNSGAKAVLGQGVVEAFRASLRGHLLHAGEDGYEEARTIWNGMIDRRPALIARCAGAADVISCVKFARAHHLLMAVRGGGHGVAGHAVCDGGLMIDLSRLKSIRVDPVRRMARAEPGLTWGEFDHETQTFGLACDNLLSVDLVTANGQLLTASDTEHQDLFWGVRGGGGNFGVVTAFEYQLHQVGPVLAGVVIHPFKKAKEVLTRYREFTKTAPDELASGAVLLTMPDGTPVAGVVVCYHGPLDEGERVLKPLRAFGSPLADQIGPMPYTAAQKLIDAFYPPGLQQYWKSSFLKAISDAAIDTLVAYCTSRPSPLCHAVIEHTLGGAVSRVDRDATAFNHRDVQYSFLSLGMCTDPTEVESCVRWACECWEAMQPFATGSVYVNYLGREADEGAERIKAAYGPEKYQRLVALKNTYDPTNLFRLNQNIQPTV